MEEDKDLEKEEIEESDLTSSDEDGEVKETDMEEIKKVGSDTNDTLAFYQPPTKKKGSKKSFIIITLIIVLLVGGFLLRHKIKGIFMGGAKPTPTPTPTSTPAPTPSPNPLVRSDWSLEVLNGTSTSGQAKKLADKLTALGYPVVKTGNADKQTLAQTEILVKKSFQDKIDLVVADLKDIVKISSVAGELKEGTASARITIGKDLTL